jgi:predicted HTH domain antitoxin
MPMTLDIPDEVLQAIQLPEAEKKRRLQLELACALYSQEILTSAGAARLTGMSRLEFWEEAGKRGIPRHYSEENLREDIAFADGRQ